MNNGRFDFKAKLEWNILCDYFANNFQTKCKRIKRVITQSPIIQVDFPNYERSVTRDDIHADISDK
jgi:hypothetical protein